MELSKVLDGENVICDFCGDNHKIRIISSSFDTNKEFIICKKCRKTLLSMLEIEVG